MMIMIPQRHEQTTCRSNLCSPLRRCWIDKTEQLFT